MWYVVNQKPGKTLVVIAAEDKGRHVGRIRLFRAPDASAESLTLAVQEMVQPGSIVHTDGWPGYAALGSNGYE